MVWHVDDDLDTATEHAFDLALASFSFDFEDYKTVRARPIVQIRSANQREAGAIALLIRESFGEHEPAYTREAFDMATPNEREIQKRIKEWAVWVAIHGNVIVGTVSAYSEGSGLHIKSMAVHPSMRGYGIGNLCLARVEDFARARGYKRLILNTTPFMNRAIKLYEDFGFSFTGNEQNWFGTRLRTMTKELALARHDHLAIRFAELRKDRLPKGL